MVQGMDGGSRMEDKIIKVEEVMELRGSLAGWVVHGAAECAWGQVCIKHECPALQAYKILEEL